MTTILTSQKQEFIDYVYSFYGSYDAIYPLHQMVTGQKITKIDIEKAIKVYELFLNEPESTWIWGDGDSIDRERIRSILENQFNFREV
jgi:sulfur relay (sulfurtransferase) DsrC/TusE family protein